MTALDLIVRGPYAPTPVALADLQNSHGVNAGASRMYSRFFGQDSVLMHEASHTEMIRDTLAQMFRERPELRATPGVVIYTKTQTHNTPFELDWLTEILADLDAADWEGLTLSMTNCASALAAVHAFEQGGRPMIILSGEKAFHMAGNRLSVGLLGEAPLAALFNADGSRAVVGSMVRHLPRYYLNPDDMAADDRHALQSEFESGFATFLADCVAQHQDFFDRKPVVVPYNLNVPLVQRLLRNLDLADSIVDGHSGQFGHTFCSDNFLNLTLFNVPPQTPIFLFCAGMGVTYSAVLLDAAQPPFYPNPKGPNHD
ncbi:MAG: hypothetical protein WA790_17585 [Sulfitobacter sp.]